MGAMRVLVVDDNATFRNAVRALLELRGTAIVAEAIDASDALEKLARFQPDVAVLDIQLPGMDGIDLARHISTRPDPPVVVLTSSRPAEDYGTRLTTAPARAFLAKEELSATRLARVVRGG